MVGKVSGGIRIFGENECCLVVGLTRIGETVCARSFRKVDGSPLSGMVKLRCQEKGSSGRTWVNRNVTFDKML
jgi:hypothetical protein